MIAGSDRTYIRGITSHRDHLLIASRVDGLDQLVLRDYASGREERVPFTEASYSAGFSGNPEFAPESYRLGYSSMVTPATVYDYHPADKRLEVRKVQEIPSGYDPSLYVTERLTITARDGAKVPVSVLRRKDFAKDGSGKLFVYGYGAYGFAIPPSFSTSRLSLVDRGFAYAIAHIRGGDDLGYQWFLDGKLDKRTNAFNDFVDVVRGLIAEGYARPGRVAAQGGRHSDGQADLLLQIFRHRQLQLPAVFALVAGGLREDAVHQHAFHRQLALLQVLHQPFGSRLREILAPRDDDEARFCGRRKRLLEPLRQRIVA